MNKFVAKGRVKEIMKPQSFTRKDGTEGYKSGILLDTEAKFNPLIYFDVFKDECREEIRSLEAGQDVEVSFNVSSRPYEDRYFHNLTAWSVSVNAEADVLAANDDDPF